MKIRWLRSLFPLCALFLAPLPGFAVSLQEISVQSYLGAPLRATIALHTRADEEVDIDCLKLAPPPISDDAVYLRRASLSLAGHEGNWRLEITGIHPLNEPFLNIVIQNRCQEQGGLLREYTVLIDPPNYPIAPTTSEGIALSDKTETASPPAIATASPSKVRAMPRAEPPRSLPTKARKKIPPPPAKIQRAPKQTQDQLKVVAGVGDTPAKVEQTEKEKLQQSEKDLVKNLDDNTAQFLAMQSQLEKMEARLIEMQKTIELQNRMLAAMQQTPAPVTSQPVSTSWNQYLLAGAAVVIVAMGFLIARLSRRRSLENWDPTKRVR